MQGTNSPRRSRRPWARTLVVGLVSAVLASLAPLLATPAAAATDPCGPSSNAIVCENSKPGTPKDDWFVESPYGDIEGYGTRESVQPGEQLDFKIKTPATAYTVDIVRLGYYGGNGGRLIATINPLATLPQTQPACLNNSTTGLVDCGNWAVSARWQVPADAVSGFYVANFIRGDGQSGASEFPFVVRKDSSTSEIVVQTSDQTWQAYNTYGDKPGVNEFSTYEGGFAGSADGRAYKVSYNRPYRNSGTSSFMNAEYPMVRWLERNGYDVSYISGIDASRNGALLRNHKVYMSSGHDEYANASQRTNVEAARAAGVNLAFFSGNEWFWKTRFEASTDGSNTAYRTMAVYKETKASAKIDPSPEWTGTWRDPRFSPPSDGGRPENALTGTLFEVNGFRNDRIEVPSTFGRNRFWRNTPIATATTTTTLPQGTLGYEWDTDPDNGFRPAGAIRLSDTTVSMPTGDFVLQDYGYIYGGGTKTHNMVMYRDQTSKALVFGSGTVQWSWGLDAEHLYPNGVPFAAESTTVQQATVNVLADMGAQPLSRQSNLVAATKSTDTTGPTVTVSAPANGSTVPAGTTRTISGTATDSGGVVASVEVSTDNGTTWRRATGLASWTYSWTPSGTGQAALKVRASDDSANLGATVSVNVTVGPQQCPCTVFGTQVPAQADSNDASNLELGTKVVPSVNGSITGVRFYKSAANTGTHTGSLWSTGGQRLATGTFSGESASGWQTLTFATPVPVQSGVTYIASYSTTTGHYAVDSGFFTGKGAGVAPLTAPSTESSSGNGLYRYGGGFPDSSFGGSNYWVDAVLSTTGADNTPPTVTSTTPANGATGVATDADLKVVFSEPVDPATVRFTVTRGGTAVPGTTSVDGATVTFTPTGLFTASAAHSATITASDGFGNAIAAPATWSFTTGTTSGSCPCTLFRSTTPTRTDSGDAGDVELGVKFQPSVNAFVTQVRFYKSAANTGTHTGSLWNTAGQRLATGTFANETASGWQTLTFAQPVPVTAGQTYVASYHAPNGHYSADSGFFTNQTAGRSPLIAPKSSTVGGQGVYQYGTGYPDGSFNDTNYWVDVTLSTAGADTTAPTVASRTPAAAATGVPRDALISATFSEPVEPTSVQFTVTAGGNAVPGTTSVDNATATFTPTAIMTANTAYSVTLRATDKSGNALGTPATWSFTTGTAQAGCPCTLFGSTVPTRADAGDGSNVELGVRFQTSVNARVTQIRFYKSAANTGTHTGSLWGPDGQRLATGTFAGESASGWQTLTLAQPVNIQAGLTYVTSYRAPNGHYAADTNFFATTGAGRAPLTAPSSQAAGGQGVYTYGTGIPDQSFNAGNYWVDVTVTTADADNTPPTVASTTPAAGATGVAAASLVTATFSEPVAPNASMDLTPSGGAAVPGTTSVAADGLSATFTPNTPLAAGTAHTARVIATDRLGNAMSTPVSWSFTTAAGAPQCPCSIFRPTDAPAFSATDSQVELGMRWTPSVNGTVTAIRFYKIAGDTGTHSGSLWSPTGVSLATGTFANETASGWQTLQLATPVAVTAGSSYVVSYNSTRFGYTRDVFAAAKVSGPLTASATSGTAPNGLFRYGPTTAVPDGNGGGTAYWADLVFVPAP